MADKTPADGNDSGGQPPSGQSKPSSGQRKANLPGARDLSGAKGSFKPQGYRSNRGVLSTRPKPSSKRPLTPRARRRRTIVAGVAALAVAGGGAGAFAMTQGGEEPAAKPKAAPTPSPTGPIGKIKYSEKFGKDPKLELAEKGRPDPTFKATVLAEGKGAEVEKPGTLFVKYAAKIWNAKGELKKVPGNDFGKMDPENWTFGGPQPMPSGIEKGIVGKKTGSRVLLNIPRSEGFEQDNQLGPYDVFVIVVDVLSAYSGDSAAKGEERPLDDPKLPKVAKGEPGKGPDVTIPKTDPPKKLVDKTVIQGDGPAVKKGQQLIVHYKGLIWKDSKVFDESWSKKAPAAFPIGEKAVIPAWDKTFVGKKVGSRVLLVVPPKEGYGKEGQPMAGIEGDDTLVFVVDILGAE